jgi:luciferase family oxidoreductase group 1
VRWSVLDKSALGGGPFQVGPTAAAATAALVAHARLAESLGYHRFWLPEHHVPISTHPCPSLPMMLCASATERLRVGAGCVIPHYRRPIQVAEMGRYLASNFPGRVDVGFGQGPGVPAEARPLFGAPGEDEERRQRFRSAVQESCALMREPGDAATQSLRAWPERPEAWVVGASPATAGLAAEAGASFAVGWLVPDMEKARAAAASVDAYRDAGGDAARTMLVVDVSSTFPGLRDVVVDRRKAGEGSRMFSVLGDSPEARAHLEEMAKTAGAAELMVTTGGLGGRAGEAMWRWLAGAAA